MTAAADTLDPYRSAFERLGLGRAGRDDGLATLRAEALGRFEALGFPTTRQEAWRYTNVAALARTPFHIADPGCRGGAVVPTLARLGFGGAFRGHEAVFVNGHFAPELSSLPAPDGIQVLSLRETLRTRPRLVEGELARIAASGDNPFLALNTAFLDDGAVVWIAPGAHLAAPLHLLFLSTTGGAAQATMSHPRTLVVAGRGSETTLVQSFGGPNGEAYLANAVTEIRLEDGARLDHYELQRDSLAAFHMGTLAVKLGRDAHYAGQAVTVGGAIVRNDVGVELEAEGAFCSLAGLFVSGGQQLHDTHTRIDHRQPHGASRQTYKGIVGAQARGVFHGRIVVHPGAQKTDAIQVNKNLLLSPEALVNSTPQLEIFADDVKCKHGSTTGQLDAGALFYLQSRGISAEAARSLLTYAFASDLVSRIRVHPVRVALETFLQDRLPSVPREAVA
jgi:Fe-S cluster assembly protein SufD